MGTGKSSGKELLGVAPYLHKWLHSCGGCGHVGHKPGCPNSRPDFWQLKHSPPQKLFASVPPSDFDQDHRTKLRFSDLRPSGIVSLNYFDILTGSLAAFR